MPEFNEADHSQEPLDDAQLFGLLNGVGNHEAKLFATALVTSHPNQGFSAVSLKREMTDRQGETPAWPQSIKTAFNYCSHSLAPIGAVVKTHIEGSRGPIEAYQASEFGEHWGLALSGALLDWSLKYPDISLQDLFGRSTGGTSLNSPEIRYKLYLALLTSPTGKDSYIDTFRATGLENSNPLILNEHIRKLSDMGILDTESREANNDPTFIINDPRYAFEGTAREDNLKYETRVIFAGFQRLFSTGVRQWQLTDLLKVCAEIDPSVDLAELRKTFVLYTSNENDGSFPGIKNIRSEDYDPTKLSTVSINAAFVEPLEDLCSRIEGLDDPDKVHAFKQLALDIISDTSKVHALMAKARRFSAGYFAHSEGGAVLESRIIAIVRRLGTVTVNQVSEELSGEKVLDKGTITKAFRKMTAGNVLSVQNLRGDESRSRTRPHYSLKT